ncbi:MAG: FtsL-like putative cell division protein [Bacteroidia bacterium]
MNKIRQSAPEPKEKSVAKQKAKSESAARKLIRVVNIFEYFDRKSVVVIMPYMFFLFFLGLTYIANSYYAEKSIRDIDKTGRDLKELRAEFITARNDLMYRSKLTEVAKAIEVKEVKEARIAPSKIVVKVKSEK